MKSLFYRANRCLLKLYTVDRDLMDNDVSERSITHKLAEYLQAYFPDKHVDVEYNRNSDDGMGCPKRLQVLETKRQDSLKELNDTNSSETYLETSTYPDIVIHRRLSNAGNILVIEVKKSNSRIDQEYDRSKLKAFTDPNYNSYRYKFGLSILLDTGRGHHEPPKLEWFRDGKLLRTCLAPIV